ncbi:MAG TPA: hypothetical protein VHF51_07575, partial [Solirubrobacteraceae bacterium]|nr:hypothetical protein [Solirubrobacteraceae bacterium]
LPRRRGDESIGAMTLSDRASVARLVLIERRDTVAPRDPRAARVRRYRLARTQVSSGRTVATDVGPRSWARS